MEISFRIGNGYDIHRIARDRPLVLGGVTVPAPFGLEGHSDADVLSHAIADAILGAAGLPDIGHHFPNSNPEIKGIDSQKIVAFAREAVAALGWKPVNVDSVIIAESPRLAPFLAGMKERLAATLGLTPAAIGIKVTSNEQLGPIGRGEGIAAHAVVLLQRG